MLKQKINKNFCWCYDGSWDSRSYIPKKVN